MSYQDQFPYPYEEHHWLVSRVNTVEARLNFLFEDTWFGTYHHHRMPLLLPLTDRPDLYVIDAWDEGGIGDQLLPAVGHQLAEYLIEHEHPRVPIHHICWWGQLWEGRLETWRTLDHYHHGFFRNLHVAFVPEVDDDETNAPVPPDLP